MDSYHAGQVFSSIDRGGRYAFGAQADIIIWNMAQLATCLVPLMPDEDAAVERFTKIVHGMADTLRREWLKRFCAKVGIATPSPEDGALVGELLKLMQTDRADFTNTFRALLGDDARDQFTDRSAFDAWATRWRKRIESEPDPEGLMRRTNPAVIPRNHRIEQMIAAAVEGDDAPFHRLNAVLSRPFDEAPEDEDLRRPPTEAEIVPATFCGT